MWMSSEHPTLSRTGLFPVSRQTLLPQCSPTVASHSNQVPWGRPSIFLLSLFGEHTRIQRLTTTLVPTVAHLDYCNVLPKWAPPLVWSESQGQSEPVAITSLLCSKILSPAGKQPKPLKSPIRPRPMSSPAPPPHRHLLTHLLLPSSPEHQPHGCSSSEPGSPASYAPTLLPLLHL